MKHFLALAMLALFALPSLAISATAPQHTHYYQLDNGLTVLVRENHQAPVVTVMTWYKVGSIDEPAGMTGISHVLEHMMFKGTKHLKPGEFSDWVSRFGGSENAMTSYDFTAYYQNYAANRLPLALELEAERMQHLVIDAKEFASEIDVVKEERRLRVLDNPNAQAWEKFATITRPGTGYAHPVIGWMEDLDTLTTSKLEHWYQQYYQPQNAFLVIVGDVDIDRVKTLVKRHFGHIKNNQPPRHASEALMAAPGERQIILPAPVKVPVLHIAFNVPTLSNAANETDFYALAMLSGILDDGMSSRLESRLVRQQKIAASVSAGYSGVSRGGALFTLSATPNPGVSLATLQTALLNEIDALKNHPPGADEMARVQASVLAGDVYGKDSNFGQAMSLGRLLINNLPWQLDTEFAHALKQVSAEDIRHAAQQFLVNEQRAIAYVIPADADPDVVIHAQPQGTP